ncbi:MAG: hypothetical protein VCD00_01100 [Candidatus Hydrogenedentota bacterium]
MRVLKQISRILTPPTRHTSREERTDLGPGKEVAGAARIGDILKCLLVDEKPGVDNIQAELSELRDIASKLGIYMVACEIRECVSSMPHEDKKGRMYKKGRGFELAADLHQQNLSIKLSALSEGRTDMGPEGFSRYFREVLDCFFLAKKHRKGIQVCLGTCEELLIRACDRSGSAQVFPSLAQECVAVILELVLREKERNDHSYSRAKQENRRSDTPLPRVPLPPDFLDDGLHSYLSDSRERIVMVASALAKAKAKANIDIDFGVSGTRNVFEKRLAYTEFLRKISSISHYHPLEVFAFEQAGAIKEAIAPGNGLTLYKMAAQVSEKQAKRERDRNLRFLSRRHFEKAADMWYLAGDIPRAKKARTLAYGQRSD